MGVAAGGYPFLAQRARTAARSRAYDVTVLKTKKPAAGGGAAGFPKRTEQTLKRPSAGSDRGPMGGGAGRLNSKICGGGSASLRSRPRYLCPLHIKQTLLQCSHVKNAGVNPDESDLQHSASLRPDIETPASSAGAVSLRVSRKRLFSEQQTGEQRWGCRRD